MLSVLLSLAAIFILLVVIEYAWRKKKLKPEVARKIIHIGAGSFIAFWPYFMSWTTIQLLSLALFIVVYLSHHFGIFGSIHNVSRSTIGELFYPVSIGIIGLLEPQPWVFAAAILHMAIGDGIAAIVGVKYGKNNQYKIAGHVKSIAGSAAFFVVSAVIIATVYLLNLSSFTPEAVAILICLPLFVTLIENFFIAGIDNVLVPLSVVLVLNALPL